MILLQTYNLISDGICNSLILLILIIWPFLIMQTLKITFNGKNKMISASNSAYKEITGKIYNSFNLNNDKIYHFFYLDDEQ